MPELPEVQTVASELNQKLKNKTIRSVEVRLAKIVSFGPGTLPPKRRASSLKVTKFIKLLKGQRIRSVTRRAKLIIFDFFRKAKSRPLPASGHPPLARGGDNGGFQPDLKIDGSLALLVHLKMTGQFIYFRKTELGKQVRIINKQSAPLVSLPTKYTHVIFSFTDGSQLFYNDVRQFGYLKLVSDRELPHVRELREFGPEPLDKKFTYGLFESILKRRPNMPIKQLLVEPKLIAGIGNIYSDEILFRAKVKPARRVKSLKERERKTIYAAIPFILKKGIVAKGSSVGDFIRTDGSWGQMGKYHFVYARSGKPCKVCGTIIQSKKFGGRTSSFCPRCQK